MKKALLFFIILTFSFPIFAQNPTKKTTLGNEDFGKKEKLTLEEQLKEIDRDLERKIKENRKPQYKIINKVEIDEYNKRTLIGTFTLGNDETYFKISVESVERNNSKQNYIMATYDNDKLKDLVLFTSSEISFSRIVQSLSNAIKPEVTNLNETIKDSIETNLYIYSSSDKVTLYFEDSKDKDKVIIPLDKYAASVLRDFLIEANPYKNNSKTKAKK